MMHQSNFIGEYLEDKLRQYPKDKTDSIAGQMAYELKSRQNTIEIRPRRTIKYKPNRVTEKANKNLDGVIQTPTFADNSNRTQNAKNKIKTEYILQIKYTLEDAWNYIVVGALELIIAALGKIEKAATNYQKDYEETRSP